MTADTVQARYEQLDQVAARFAKASASSAELQRSVQRCVEVLEHGGWQGRGADAFFAEMHGTMYPAMQRLIKALEQGRATTLQIKDVMQAAEEEAARLFQQARESQAPAAATEKKQSSSDGEGVIGFVGDLFEGAGAELGDMVDGVVNLATHPVDTVKGLWYGVNHPSALWDAFKKPYVEDWENGHPGRAIGRGILFAGSILLGTKGADKALKAVGIGSKGAEAAEVIGTTGRVAEATDVTGTAGRASEAVQTARTAAETADTVTSGVTRAVQNVDEVSAAILRDSAEVVNSRSNLIAELEAQGIKHNPNEIVRITRDGSDRVVFLETGKTGERAAGLKHILEEHADDFANQGIQPREIPDYLMKALEDNSIVGHQGRGTGRPIYEFMYQGQKRRVAISVGDNGYIVGANPRPMPMP